MTDVTEKGWPDNYSDSRDRPHPSVLRITVESFNEIQEETLDTVESVANGEQPHAVVSFASVGDLWKMLTDRDHHTVHDDVSLLADHGLLFVAEDGNSKRPYLPSDRIRLYVELGARVHRQQGGTR